MKRLLFAIACMTIALTSQADDLTEVRAFADARRATAQTTADDAQATANAAQATATAAQTTADQLTEVIDFIDGITPPVDPVDPEPSTGGPTTEAASAPTSLGAVAEVAGANRGRVKIDRERVAEAILEASQRSDELNRRQKRRYKRVFSANRPRSLRQRERAIDESIDRMLQAGVIVATEDGVEAALDWDGILQFLEGIIPILERIFEIFGMFSDASPSPSQFYAVLSDAGPVALAA